MGFYFILLILLFTFPYMGANFPIITLVSTFVASECENGLPLDYCDTGKEEAC